MSSTLPLCQYPCSACPDQAPALTHGRRAEIQSRWVAAHAVVSLAPTAWYLSPSPLKLVTERLVYADGGNPVPTSGHGKRAAQVQPMK